MSQGQWGLHSESKATPVPLPYSGGKKHPYSEGLVWSYVGSPHQSGISEFPLAQVSYFIGYPPHGVDAFAHIVDPLSLQLVFGSSELFDSIVLRKLFSECLLHILIIICFMTANFC